MGPTGCGKSKLSIDLATRFFPSEIINSDKVQVYNGLDITTNKIPIRQRFGVPHHLLGEFNPSESQPEFAPSDFRPLASSTISSVISRRKLPLVVGGSNSFIYALLAKRFNPSLDVFDPELYPANPVCTELRYNCCFLWVDVSPPVLNQYLCERVDEMFDSGMFEELEDFYTSGEVDSVSQSGLKKAIGVPEFEIYFKRFGSRTTRTDPQVHDVYEEAIKLIKDNTCQLAKRQLWKIQRLRDAGWDLRRIDATEAFRAAMGVSGSDSGSRRVSDIWERQVVEPSVKIVKKFSGD
ncbi:unnamed protein product [Ilex paraguariensis]|uniref:Adenylate isopentenyltransferase n=1 Tax=Ilex paraguariensis TaxID=185542 RepID=A0ABC8RSR8_9AQUA